MVIHSPDFNNDSESDDITVESDQTIRVLCQHCGRTSNNRIKCIGKCVADSNY